MAMPGRHERPPAAGRRRWRPRARAGRARRRPGGRRRAAAGRGRAGRPARQRHGRSLRVAPSHLGGCVPAIAESGVRTGAPESPPDGAPAVGRRRSPGRSPGPGCRTRSLVDVARQAIADGAVDDAPARAEALRRTLLTPVVNATGVLLHTNLGRAPLAHHQDARAQSLELDLATGERGLAPAGRRPAASPGCAAPRRRWSSTTTPPPCCSCSPPSPPGGTCR